MAFGQTYSNSILPRRCARTVCIPSIRSAPKIDSFAGVWVLYTGQPLPAAATDEMLRQIREDRDLAQAHT
jgi:hypothetical protein